MRCEDAIVRLLEAEPAELRGRGETKLARHVAECPRCARVAAALLAEMATLDEVLAGYASAGDADAAADRALGGIEHRASRRPLRSWRGGVGVSIAAAAGLAALLLLGRDGETPGVPAAEPAPEPPARVAVTPPSDRGVAVLETENPKITIVWLYEREES